MQTPDGTTTRYRSTRGGETGVSFRQAVLKGLADDGGLFVPEVVPQVDAATLEAWSALPYSELAFQVIRRFIPEEEVPSVDLQRIVTRSYSTFDDPSNPVPVKPVPASGKLYGMELFHGPSLSFKDVALQFLGNLFEFFLENPVDGKPEVSPSRITVVGATSGDTGSAAIYGLRGKKNVHVFILHPKGRVSKTQELQMTTVLDANVHNVAVEGTFDDCQNIVKALFGDLELKQRLNLGAVNSINWARILAQTVYYFWGFFQHGRRAMRFAVPTGNFGDILAGYYARRIGLPCEGLLVCTNANDILHRFFSTGAYHKREAVASLSPAMDIQISSNFERYLFHLCGDDGPRVAAMMHAFRDSGELTLAGDELARAQRDFASQAVSDADCLDCIRRYHAKGHTICPHSAVAFVAAERQWGAAAPEPAAEDPLTVCLETAHPGKFPDAVLRALGEGGAFDQPEALLSLHSQEARVATLPNDAAAVRRLVEATAAR